MQGDVNLDGNLNILDIVLLANFILGEADLTDIGQIQADFNADGYINVQDIVYLAFRILGTD